MRPAGGKGGDGAMRRLGSEALRKWSVSGAIRRFFSLHGRRIAVLWRSLAGPGRRVKLPKRSIV
jgi:hypothetical protein